MTVKDFAERQRLRTRLDEDGTDIIPGKLGHVYEYDNDWLGVIVMPKGHQPKYWAYAKKAFAAVGLQVVQDGDFEGAATFNPSDRAQISAALRAAGVHRIRVSAPPSPAQLESRDRFARMQRSTTKKGT